MSSTSSIISTSTTSMTSSSNSTTLSNHYTAQSPNPLSNSSSPSTIYKPFCVFIWSIECSVQFSDSTDRSKPPSQRISSLSALLHEPFGAATSICLNVEPVDNNSSLNTSISSPTNPPISVTDFKQAFSKLRSFIQSHAGIRSPLLVSHNSQFDFLTLSTALKQASINIPTWHYASVTDLAAEMGFPDHELTRSALAQRFQLREPDMYERSVQKNVNLLSEILSCLQEVAQEKGMFSKSPHVEYVLWRNSTPFIKQKPKTRTRRFPARPVSILTSSRVTPSPKVSRPKGNIFSMPPITDDNDRAYLLPIPKIALTVTSNSVKAESSLEEQKPYNLTTDVKVMSISSSVRDTVEPPPLVKEEQIPLSDQVTEISSPQKESVSASPKYRPELSSENLSQEDSESNLSTSSVKYYTIESGSVYHQDTECRGLGVSMKPRRTHLSLETVPTSVVVVNEENSDQDNDSKEAFYTIPTGEVYHTHLDCEGLNKSSKPRTKYTSLANVPSDRRVCSFCKSRNTVDMSDKVESINVSRDDVSEKSITISTTPVSDVSRYADAENDEEQEVYYTIPIGQVYHLYEDCQDLEVSTQPRTKYSTLESIPSGRTECMFCKSRVGSNDRGGQLGNIQRTPARLTEIASNYSSRYSDDGLYNLKQHEKMNGGRKYYTIPTGQVYHLYLDCEGLENSSQRRDIHDSLESVPVGWRECEFCAQRSPKNSQNSSSVRNLYKSGAYNEASTTGVTKGTNKYYTISSGQVYHVTPNCRGLQNTSKPLETHDSFQDVPYGRRACRFCC